MPDIGESLTRLPDLIAEMLSDLKLAFMRDNAKTLRDVSTVGGPVFKMGDSEVQFRGRVAQAEAQKLFFFPAEQTEKGAEFAIRLPVHVEYPPDNTPWALTMGNLVFEENARRKIYKAAQQAMPYVSMAMIGSSPIWRVGPGEYMVVMQSPEGARVASVKREGKDMVGVQLDTEDALRAILGVLADNLASQYKAVLGKVT